MCINARKTPPPPVESCTPRIPRPDPKNQQKHAWKTGAAKERHRTPVGVPKEPHGRPKNPKKRSKNSLGKHTRDPYWKNTKMERPRPSKTAFSLQRGSKNHKITGHGKIPGNCFKMTPSAGPKSHKTRAGSHSKKQAENKRLTCLKHAPPRPPKAGQKSPEKRLKIDLGGARSPICTASPQKVVLEGGTSLKMAPKHSDCLS